MSDSVLFVTLLFKFHSSKVQDTLFLFPWFHFDNITKLLTFYCHEARRLNMKYFHMNVGAVFFISLASIISLCVIPSFFSFQFQSPPDLEIKSTPIFKAVHSNSYLISLISSASMSVHLLVDFVGHNFISREDIFSYRDSFSKLVILAFLLTPDLAQLFIVIPESNYVAYMLIRFIRYVSWMSATFGYLARYGGPIWCSKAVIFGLFLVDLAWILKFISFFDVHLNSLAIISNSLVAFGLIIFAVISYQYIRKQIIFFMKNIQISSDDYCCNVYLVAFWITCFGLAFQLMFNDFPHWYEVNTEMVVAETMLYTVYYVVITVFQGKAALVDAVASKVP